jgi:transposase-like protein
MARRSRRTFTPELRAKVVLDVLTGAASRAEACRKRQISPSLLALWKATPLEDLGLLEARSEGGYPVDEELSVLSGVLNIDNVPEPISTVNNPARPP